MNYTNSIIRKAGTQLAQSIRPDDAEYNIQIAPWETMDRYEIYEMKWPNGALIPSHIHKNGIETFYILEGTAEVVLAGNKFSVKAGDLIHTPKHVPHYFLFSENSRIIALFFDVHYFSKEGGGILARKYPNPESFKPDAQYMRNRSVKGDTYMFDFIDPVENDNYHLLRRAGEQVSSHKDDKGTYNLKVAQWETDGIGEIWETVWNKDAKVEMHRHVVKYESFYVASGSLEVNDGQQVYIAQTGDCVHFRAGVPHSIKCLEENTKTIDLTMNTDPEAPSVLQSRIDLDLVKKNNPELLEDAKFTASLDAKNDFNKLTE